jgi:hypothetical protein
MYLSKRDAPGATTTVQPIEGTSDITGPERPQQSAFRGTSLIGPRLFLPATILSSSASSGCMKGVTRLAGHVLSIEGLGLGNSGDGHSHARDSNG